LTELGKSLKDEGKKEKAIEIAKIAIKKGMDNDTISELTGLNIVEIELIREVLK
jgi:transcription initiation factor IIE alpha subunit